MKRNSTIDIAKGIGILLVVLGHNWIILHEKGELARVIASFLMPLFFFLAGLFLKTNQTFRNLLQSRADALLKPFFVVLGLLGLARLLGALVTGKAAGQDVAYFAKMCYGTGQTIPWIPLWFLPHLFVASAAAIAILKFLEGRSFWWRVLLVPGLLAPGVFFIEGIWNPGRIPLGFMEITRRTGLPWSVDLLPLTTAFLVMGKLLAREVMQMTFRPGWFAVALICFGGLHAATDEMLDLNYRQYGNFLTSTMLAGLGIYLCLSFSSLLQRVDFLRRGLEYTGSGSLFILLFHCVIEGKCFEVLKPWVASPWLNGAIGFVVAAGVPLLLWELTKRSRLLSALLLPRKAIQSENSAIRQTTTESANPGAVALGV
jgi:fucose 4-O-acetylase-like acetyltransferase